MASGLLLEIPQESSEGVAHPGTRNDGIQETVLQEKLGSLEALG
jgi:hypothetical protein